MKEKYGFVYIWLDKKHKRYYIGSHWGNINDGYKCSSTWMKQAYKHRPLDFKRRIVSYIHSSKQDLLTEENRWLAMIKPEELKKRYYNIRIHEFGHWSANKDLSLTVGQKISASPNRRENIAKSCKNQKFSDYAKECQRKVMVGRVQSEEEKIKRAASMKGKTWKVKDTSKMSESAKHKKHSEETKKKISNSNRGKTWKVKDTSKMGNIKGNVSVTDINGNNLFITREEFFDQRIGKRQNWNYVGVSSKEAAHRRLRKKSDINKVTQQLEF